MQNDVKPKDNVVPFQRPNTSNDDGTVDGNWLRQMCHGTRFLATSRTDNSSELIDFVVASDPKSMPAVYLGRDINSPHGGFKFYRPDKFVRDYDFFMTLEILEPPNGDDNQVQPGAVVSDAGTAKRVKVHARKQRIPPGDEPG